MIDSLQNQLLVHHKNKEKAGANASILYDSTAVNIMIGLAKAHFGNNPEEATAYTDQSMELAKRINYLPGIANANYCYGNIAMDQGDYTKALNFVSKSLHLYLKSGDKTGLAACYNTIGIIHWNQGSYSNALKNYYAALGMMEELGNKYGVAVIYGNIGIINVERGDDSGALRNYFASLKILQQINNRQGIATSYNNIGNVFADEGKYDEAIKYYSDALKLQSALRNDDGMSISYNNIGEVYLNLGEFDKALENFFSAMTFQQKIGDKEGLSGTALNTGVAYLKKRNYAESKKYLKLSLGLSKEIGSLDNLKNNYEALVKLDSAQGDYKSAFQHHKLFVATRDSLLNEENTRKMVQTEMQFSFDKKEALTLSEQEKKNALARKEIQKQILIRNGFVLLLLVMAISAAVFLNQRNKIRNGKKRSDELLLNILPEEVADELKKLGGVQPKQFNNVTVMFTDFKDFTLISEKLSPNELVAEIDICFKAFDQIISSHQLEKIKTIGDSYMCVGGLPLPNNTHPFDMVKAALEIQKFISDRYELRKARGEFSFEIRMGIHTGPVIAGIVGSKKFAYDIWGDTVNIASRMESSSEAGKVNISESTYDAVKSSFHCVSRGKVQAKNKGEIGMYFVEGSRSI